ncbi:hypothetical protein AVEN_209085-1 [Araneus ventricosus]|uniref:Uncharacterized protein n=1 Tax=Araneus ventricosus TaxID=182803 RepID=A0A4Y2IIN6_ARAVE|nr:hypothetical protein AVEN_209085-1 [Araneus ventricosus]
MAIFPMDNQSRWNSNCAVCLHQSSLGFQMDERFCLPAFPNMWSGTAQIVLLNVDKSKKSGLQDLSNPDVILCDIFMVVRKRCPKEELKETDIFEEYPIQRL